jgi:hypothetical protein
MNKIGLASRRPMPSLDRLCPSVGLDTRQQIAMAARFLRSIRPEDGDVEIMLHEMARRLEQVVEAGGGRGQPVTLGGAREAPAADAG